MKKPKITTCQPYYPFESDLWWKYQIHLTHTENFVNDETNIMTYKKDAREQKAGKEFFNVPDAVTWQAAHLVGLCFYYQQLAPSDDNREHYLLLIKYLLDGINLAHRVAEIPGQLARSIVVHNANTPPFNPSSSGQSWTKSRILPYWFRGAASKGLYNFVVSGLGIIKKMILDGKLNLPADFVDKINAIIINCVNYAYGNDWVLSEKANLDLRDPLPKALHSFAFDFNGYNALLRINLVKALSLCVPRATKFYHEEFVRDINVAQDFCDLLGTIGRYVGRHRIPLSYSFDMQVAMMIFSFIMMGDINTELGYIKAVKKCLKYLWRYAQYLRNPMFTVPYVAFESKNQYRLAEIVADLKQYPKYPKYKYNNKEKEDENRVYTIGCRPTSSFYPKEKPYEYAVVSSGEPIQRTDLVYNSSDFIFFLPIMRYLKLI